MIAGWTFNPDLKERVELKNFPNDITSELSFEGQGVMQVQKVMESGAE